MLNGLAKLNAISHPQTHAGMNLGRMLVLKKVKQWNREKMENGSKDTTRSASSTTSLVGHTVNRLGDDPLLISTPTQIQSQGTYQ